MIAKRILMFASLLVLILASTGIAAAESEKIRSMEFGSGTYYYTDAYFKKTFGDVKALPTTTYLVKDSMVYVDSKAFADKFGSVPVAHPPSVTQLPLTPGKNTTTATGLNLTTNETQIVIVPMNLNNETNVTVVPSAANETPNIIVVPVNLSKGPTETGVVNTGKGNKSVSLAAAAVNGQGMPMQIIIIGFLVIIVVIMLAVLLTREEKKPSDTGKAPKKAKSEKKEKKEEKKTSKGDLTEGAFFKEAREKRAKKEKAQSLQTANLHAGSKNEPRAKKEAAPAKTSDTKEVKPFLLKIKDES